MSNATTRLAKQLLRLLRDALPGRTPCTPPAWLAASRWKPLVSLGKKGDTTVIAVDLIPSASIPRSLYKHEVLKLLRNRPELRVIVCCSEDALADNPLAEDVCRKYGASTVGRLGLKGIVPGLGLQTVIPIDLEAAQVTAAIPTEPGWFPQALLERSTGLTKLSFSRTLDDFAGKVAALGDDQQATLSLVMSTIDRLLQHYPECHANKGSFMKLAHFEWLLRQASPYSSEHVFHSFRVFLTGCSVLNQFHQEFHRAHGRYCVAGSNRAMSIEYCWLLVAIFHDIGRPLEAASELLEQELEDEDVIVSVSSKDTRWVRQEYNTARRVLCSLGAFVASSPRRGERWDGGAVPDSASLALEAAWTLLHDRLTSHAVISAFRLLAEVVSKAQAADERKNRPFVLAHAVPAALSILLHDWRIWDNARKWKLIPVDMRLLPLAGMLMFLDTWDDYRRRNGPSPMHVERFEISSRAVEVGVHWASPAEFEKQKGKIKYAALNDAIKSSAVKFCIKWRVGGAT